MSLGKRDIVKNISSRTQLSSVSSKLILDKFIDVICSESVNRIVKLSNFGTFYLHNSPKRIGRNPKTKQEFIIPKRSKLALKVSNSIRNFVN